MNHTTPSKNAAWQAAYGLTERQSELVVALITIRQLGFDGATSNALRDIGIKRHQVALLHGLKCMRLVEIVGRCDESRQQIWAVTKTAFRRFGQQMPREVPTEIETVAGRAELMADRAQRRRSARKARAA